MLPSFPDSRTQGTEESELILSRIAADGFAAASLKFPPASLAIADFMTGLTIDVGGRSVIVTFRRRQVKKRGTTWYTWNFHEAKYVRSP
jgi:hypothetical protein